MLSVSSIAFLPVIGKTWVASSENTEIENNIAHFQWEIEDSELKTLINNLEFNREIIEPNIRNPLYSIINGFTSFINLANAILIFTCQNHVGNISGIIIDMRKESPIIKNKSRLPGLLVIIEEDGSKIIKQCDQILNPFDLANMLSKIWKR